MYTWQTTTVYVFCGASLCIHTVHYYLSCCSLHFIKSFSKLNLFLRKVAGSEYAVFCTHFKFESLVANI